MMPVRLRKIVRDLMLARFRTAGMVIAIAVSVTGLGALLTAKAIVDHEMTRDYTATRPASATLVVPAGIDEATLAVVRRQPEVLEAAMRATLRGRIRIAGIRRPLLLFVFPDADPLRVSRYAARGAVTRVSPETLLLERSSLAAFGARAGDAVDVQLAGSAVARRMTVAGGVYDAALPPSSQEGAAFGYAGAAAARRLKEGPRFTQLKILVGTNGVPSADSARIEAVAQTVGRALRARGVTVAYIEVPPPLRHPHQGIMNAVLAMLLAFGVASIGLSGILVATVLNALLAQHVRQIGIMKAVGARTGQVAALYLAMTAIIAAAATALALVPATLLGIALALVTGSLLNVEIVEARIPVWVIAVELGAGVLIPLSIAAIPVLRGARISVRRAIDEHGGASAAYRPSAFEAMLARLARSESLVLAVRNTFRAPTRALLSIGLLAAAGSMFLGALNTADGFASMSGKAVANRRYDVEIGLTQARPVDAVLAVMRGVPGVETAEAWHGYAASRATPGLLDVRHTYPDGGHNSFTVYALPPRTRLVDPSLRSGRWLRDDDVGAVVVNQAVEPQEQPGLALGDTLRLGVDGHPVSLRVVGIVADYNASATAYVNERTFARALGGSADAQLVRVATQRRNDAGRRAVVAAAQHRLEAAGMPVAGAFFTSQLSSAVDGHVLVLVDVMLLLAAVMAVVGLLGLASALSTNVIERTREFGVLRAIGASTSAVRTMVAVEGGLIAAAGALVAVPLSIPLTIALDDYLGTLSFRIPLPFETSPAAIVLWFVAIALGAAAATLFPALGAARLTVRESLSHH